MQPFFAFAWILLPVIKLALTYLRLGTKIDSSTKTVTFQHLLTSKKISNTDILEWGIRSYTDVSWSRRFFECKLKNGSTFIYPFSEGSYPVFGLQRNNDRRVTTVEIADILGSEPKNYSSLKGLARELKLPRYGLWWTYSI